MAIQTYTLGTVTAYADARAGGYTGTKEEWQASMAAFGSVADQAKVDADRAETARTAAETASANAVAAAQTVTDSVTQISQNTTALAAIQTATSSDVGKVLKAKTVTEGKVTEWEFDETSDITLDKTLTIEGDAADAKAVGDKFDSIFTEEPTANHFNKDAAVIGSYINPYSGEIVEYSGVFHGFIGFVAGAYTFLAQQGVFGANAYTVPIFDENQNFVSYAEGTYTTIDSMTCIVTVTFSSQAASIGKYFSINGTTEIIDTLMVVKGEQYPSEYVPYGTYKTISGLQISKSQIIDLDNETNLLKGKIISINGDSIAAGAGYNGGYGKIIAEENGMTYENIAVGGGTVAYVGTNNHCICRTINNMRADADYVILDGGGNDADAGVALGTLSIGYDATLDDTTFAGAFESMLKSAIARFPTKKIGYVFIHKCAYLFDSRVANSYYDIAKSACEKWGIPYIDLNTQTPPLAYISALKNAYTANGDGYHPNEQGYKLFYVPKITAWLKTL